MICTRKQLVCGPLLHHVRFVQRYARKHKRFFDKIRITARAGNGGGGQVSHSRAPNVNKDFRGNGPPDGGDGGRGGDVIIRVKGFHSDLQMKRNFTAEKGRNGRPNNMNGRNGKDVTIDIPRGTVVKLLGSKDTQTSRRPVRVEVDLMEEGEELQLCHGGSGGIGNQHSHRKYTLEQRPWEKDWTSDDAKGELGQVKHCELELKSIADIGLVGFPNAGKSTLLDAVSNARPMCAPFPFTTLNPILGVLKHDNDDLEDFRCVIADIPGLIEGAHDNKGLGHEFLRHIERTQVLLYILDIAGSEFRDPIQDFMTLQNELELYSPALLEKPSFIFANKIDINQEESERNISRIRSKTEIPVYTGSALQKLNLEILCNELRHCVKSQKSQRQTQIETDAERFADLQQELETDL